METILWTLPGQEQLGQDLRKHSSWEEGEAECRRFPDGEVYVRWKTPVKNKRVILLASLDHPDDKILPLLFLSSAAKDLGASRVDLVAPYLAYLRQDIRFQEGEGITSRYFASILSRHFDGLVTVDPHLHRYHSLNEIYSIPSRVVSAAPAIAQWVAGHVKNPFFIGPDSESAQWVAEIATRLGAPYSVLKKQRLGDRKVEITLPELEGIQGRQPILIDDIISTAVTLIETVYQLKNKGFPPPLCIGVHGIFAGEAFAELGKAGVASIVTCNTIPHPSNQIDLSQILSGPLLDILK